MPKDAVAFDALTRSLTSAGSRRRALTGLLSSTLGFLGARAEETAAKNCKKIKNKTKRKKCLAKAKCVPSCAGKVCGDDGCGGVCGVACPSTHTCLNGSCFCAPKCAGKACGPDGCGDVCGTCTAPRSCQSGQCACFQDECNGACMDACAHNRARDPDCNCCVRNGFNDMSGSPCLDCCSKDCNSAPTGWMCVGIPHCDPCTFDAQCADEMKCQNGHCSPPGILCFGQT